MSETGSTVTIGIDLGTSNSCVASVIGGKVVVAPDSEGNTIHPSVVSFGDENKVIVGREAKALLLSNPRRTVYSIKRLMGRKIFSAEAKKASRLYPYEIVEGESRDAVVKIGETRYTPSEISAFILRKMKTIAEEHFKKPVTHAVVTVPAYFNDNQRQATRDACIMAGMTPLRIINEPTAATLAYGQIARENAKLAVYDLGGGTFDISILELCDTIYEVIATAGDTYLGGDDFDDRIIDFLADRFQKSTQIDLRSDPAALQKLRVAAESAKKRLSYETETLVHVPGVVADKPDLSVEVRLSRKQFNELCLDLVQRTFKVCDEALQESGLKVSDLDRIIFVGGSTKMPILFETCTEYFGKKPYREINPDEVVAVGAAVQADSLFQTDPLHSNRRKTKALLLDVTPLTLSVATVGGFVEPIIEANTPIPTEQKKSFMTGRDNQESVHIQVYQGKSRRTEENELLGEFEFSGLRKAPRGEVVIDIRFEIDTDGIVHVSATDKETGLAQNAEIRLATRSERGVSESTQKLAGIREVKLKPDLPEAVTKTPCLLELKDGSKVDGLALNFQPGFDSLILSSETEIDISKRRRTFQRAEVRWVLETTTLSDISRHLEQFSEHKSASAQEFNLNPKLTVYGFPRIQGKTTVIYLTESASEGAPRIFVLSE